MKLLGLPAGARLWGGKKRMAQTIIRHSSLDLGALPAALRAEHARFLGQHRGVLVTYGPLGLGGAPAGYLYQVDLPDRPAVARFLGADPFGNSGVFHATIVSEWHCALAHRLPDMPPRPDTIGFFFHGIGVPDVTRFRNTIVDAHRAHLQPKDASHCVSRGYLTDRCGKVWMGSAMVYEFRDRAQFDDFFCSEPYCTSGLYQRIDVYDWRRGTLA
jgi:uncharacterized protein YciI